MPPGFGLALLEPRRPGTGRPFCACAARLARRSAPWIRVPPNLKARFSGPERLVWRGNEVVSAKSEPMAIGGNSEVCVASLGGPPLAKVFSTGRDTGWSVRPPRRGDRPLGHEFSAHGKLTPGHGGSGFVCKAHRSSCLMGHSRQAPRSALFLLQIQCPFFFNNEVSVELGFMVDRL